MMTSAGTAALTRSRMAARKPLPEVVAENSPSEEVRERTYRLARDRARLHRFPEAVAQALRQIPRSKPFDDLDQLKDLRMPVLVVASHDEVDPGHPYETAVRWAGLIPDAELISEEPRRSAAGLAGRQAFTGDRMRSSRSTGLPRPVRSER